MVRSVSKWSAGVDDTEDSIQSAYLEIIKNAEHFIYIEVCWNTLNDMQIGSFKPATSDDYVNFLLVAAYVWEFQAHSQPLVKESLAVKWAN